jgi:hypothetical protein
MIRKKLDLLFIHAGVRIWIKFLALDDRFYARAVKTEFGKLGGGQYILFCPAVDELPGVVTTGDIVDIAEALVKQHNHGPHRSRPSLDG